MVSSWVGCGQERLRLRADSRTTLHAFLARLACTRHQHRHIPRFCTTHVDLCGDVVSYVFVVDSSLCYRLCNLCQRCVRGGGISRFGVVLLHVGHLLFTRYIIHYAVMGNDRLSGRRACHARWAEWQCGCVLWIRATVYLVGAPSHML